MKLRGTDRNVARDAARIAHIVRTQRFFAEDAAGVAEFIKAMNRKSVVQSFKEGQGYAPRLVMAAMLERLVLAMSRMLDPARGDKDSLSHAFELLESPQVRALVTSPTETSRIDRAIAAWDNLQRRKVLLRQFKELRDYWIAHTITSHWERRQPQFGEIFSLSNKIFAIIEDLSAGCGQTTVSFDAVKKVRKNQAVDFWRRVNRGSAILKLNRNVKSA